MFCVNLPSIRILRDNIRNHLVKFGFHECSMISSGSLFVPVNSESGFANIPFLCFAQQNSADSLQPAGQQRFKQVMRHFLRLCRKPKTKQGKRTDRLAFVSCLWMERCHLGTQRKR